MNMSQCLNPKLIAYKRKISAKCHYEILYILDYFIFNNSLSSTSSISLAPNSSAFIKSNTYSSLNAPKALRTNSAFDILAIKLLGIVPCLWNRSSFINLLRVSTFKYSLVHNFMQKSRNSRFFGYFCNLETNTLNYDKENFHQRSVVLYIPYG